jgi:C-terminal processing protease CtpA/Prc
MGLRGLAVAAVVAGSLFPGVCLAGDLTPRAAAEVLDQIGKGLDSYYFPQTARAAQAKLKADRAALVKLDTREAFAKAVSDDLYAATRDGHLKVSVQTLDAGRAAAVSEADQALIDRQLAYGLMDVRRLPGNIGYLRLSYLEQSDKGAELVDTLMGLLKDTDALILDLRWNRGGGGGSDEALLGHLSQTPIPMAKITWRNADGTTEVMQRRPRTPAGGPLYAEKPVYVLTSKRTFSAAEGVAYDLQAAHRATLVGETTGGGANPANRPVPLSYGFRIFVPNGHVEHPTTHAIWEGVGVAPDVAVPAAEALTVAYGKALAAAQPKVATPRSVKERAEALADPAAALRSDQGL